MIMLRSVSPSFIKAVALTGFGLGISSVGFAQDCDQIHFGTELIDDVTYCASSTLPNSHVATYRPANLAGWGMENARNAWCEGAFGDGVGQWFELKVRPGTSVRNLYVINGYQKTQKSFRDNARARDVTVRTNQGHAFRYRLHDRWGVQVIHLGDWQDIEHVRITIQSVYPGTKHEDLCMSGFTMDYEEKREFEFQQMRRQQKNQ